jgi:uncharacterized repeat protein (TIGR04138 family)
MSTLSDPATTPLKYHPDAYRFVDAALRFTQQDLGRMVGAEEEHDEDSAHISGPELLHGIREMAIKEFGMMSMAVFDHWGVKTTDDFGRIVFDFIERGAMRKTDRDQLADFVNVYDFQETFEERYMIDLEEAFTKQH